MNIMDTVTYKAVAAGTEFASPLLFDVLRFVGEAIMAQRDKFPNAADAALDMMRMWQNDQMYFLAERPTAVFEAKVDEFEYRIDVEVTVNGEEEVHV